jgi:single-stranded DNA-binding protein
MLSLLATGRLAATPEVRTGPSGKLYTTARLLCPAGEGGDTSISVIGFGAVGAELSTIPKGVSISVTGRAKLTRWTAKDGADRTGLSVTADAMLYARPPVRRPSHRPTFDPEVDAEDDRDPDDLDDDDPEALLRRRRRRRHDEEGEL